MYNFMILIVTLASKPKEMHLVKLRGACQK